MQSFSKVLRHVAIVLIALIISFLLFVFVGLLHGLISKENKSTEDKKSEKRIVAEYIKKPEAQQKQQVQQRIRSVQSAGTGEKNGPQQMSMKFTPDLAVDAGGGDGVAIANQELTAETFDEGETDEKAELEFMADPVFPERIMEMGVSGSVVTQFTVTYDGRVAAIDFISSPHPLLTAEVRKVLVNAKFKPARNKGIPVNVRAKKVFQFTFDG